MPGKGNGMRKLKKETIILILIMLATLTTMIYYGTKKEGYHVDELYSYGLANSEYLPFMHFGESGYDVKDWMLEYGAGESMADLFRNLAKDFKLLKECDFRLKDSVIYQDYLTAQANSADTRTTTWVSGQAYIDYLAVSDSNTFNYASVYYNQRGDVHPPLYYILLHTVCSIFQGSFSKWFGLAVNFAALLLTVWMLYRMVSRYLGGEKVALATVLVYALSCGFMTTAVYLRMYALLTFMVVTCSYVHLKLAADDFQVRKKNRTRLILSTLAGYLTHYYFVIYVMATAAVMTVWMATRKKWKEMLQYILTMAGSAVIGLCVWPFAIRHVFRGYRGQESLGILAGADFYWIKTKVILHYIFQLLYHGWWWIPAVCTMILILCCVLAKKGTRPVGKALVVILPTVIYLLLVSQIVPFYVERYFMCVFPFFCLLVTESIWLGAGMLSERGKLTEKVKLPEGIKSREGISGDMGIRCRTAAVAVCSILLFIANNSWFHMPGYLYTGGQETMDVPEHTSCVYVMPDGSWNESASYTSVFARCDRVAVAYQSDLSCLEGTYGYAPGECVLVIVSSELEPEPVLERVREVLDIQDVPEAYREELNGVTRIYLTEKEAVE